MGVVFEHVSRARAIHIHSASAVCNMCVGEQPAIIRAANLTTESTLCIERLYKPKLCTRQVLQALDSGPQTISMQQTPLQQRCSISSARHVL